MIITLSGDPAAGKSTVAKLLARRLRVKHFSAGDFVRDLAKQRGLSVVELVRLAERDRSINEFIDARTVELSHHEGSFVMDGWMAWRFIPCSFKVLLRVSDGEAARRLLEREPAHRSLAVALREVRGRRRCARAQYRAQYKVDFLAAKNYDLVIDTTRRTPAEVVGMIADVAKSVD